MLGDSQLTFLVRSWSNGKSSLPIVARLRELGYEDEAAAHARVALADPGCQDREALERALTEIASEPDGWLDALAELARNPTLERWDELMQFVPDDVLYQRLRQTIATLDRLGCEGNMLFRCATKYGMTPDTFDLARSGRVDPEVIEERGAGSPSRAAWLGLAAQAAFTRGDRFAVIRYLRDATREREPVLAWASISEIRREADDALNEDLDRAGVPRV